MEKRAAQFLPFSALTGLEAVIEEEGRLTDAPKALGEDALMALDEQLALLRARLKEDHPRVQLTRFLADRRKAGGSYLTLTGRVRRLDEANRLLLFEDGTRVDLGDVTELTVLP
jgi:hypothetical protein